MSKTIYDIFISYSSKDQKVAEGICAYLEQRHFRCFVAYRDIPKAKVWASAIVEALDESRMMVVVFSKNFNVSEQVDREIELAAEDHKPILTFRLSIDAFQGAKKYYLKNINWIDAFPEPDKCFGELAEEVEKLLGSPTVVGAAEGENTDNNSINNTQLPCLKLKSDSDCVFYLDGEERLHLRAGVLQKIPLAKGEYELMFVSEENANDRLELEFVMPDVDKLQKVNLCDIRNARLQKEAESKRIAEEKRQVEEKKRKEETEARRIAEECRLAEEWCKTEEKRLAEERRREAERKAEAERKRREEEERAKEVTFIVGCVSFKMIRVEGGSFIMGSSYSDSDAFRGEMPQHCVTLSDYYIGETPVTQKLWEAVMGNNPSKWKGDSLPVESVSWEDCQEFIKQLNKKTGKTFRLPTEAEWEYAARGGRKNQGFKYAGSNEINKVAWYGGNSGRRTNPMKQKNANELWLYDMTGNVWEWCQDWFGDYSCSDQTNPSGPSSGSYRVLRGGGWSRSAWFCRVANRDSGSSGNRSAEIGFRLALVHQ